MDENEKKIQGLAMEKFPPDMVTDPDRPEHPLDRNYIPRMQYAQELRSARNEGMSRTFSMIEQLHGLIKEIEFECRGENLDAGTRDRILQKVRLADLVFPDGDQRGSTLSSAIDLLHEMAAAYEEHGTGHRESNEELRKDLLERYNDLFP